MNRIRKPILDVLHGQVPERLPVWLMRQAGRYLPEYREIRSNSKDFLNMCLSPDKAVEITLQPIRRFGMDAAILFADILLVPMALGCKLEFREGEGPVLEKLRVDQSFDSLVYDQTKLAAVFETVRRVKQMLPEQIALIGFCGAPWTVGCYMIDGNSKNNFALAKSWVLDHPQKLAQLMDILIQASDDYLSAQIEAGAEIIQIFDSWAGLVTGADFVRYVIEPTQKLIKRLKRKYPEIPIIGFPREADSNYFSYLKQTGVDAMSIDQSVNLLQAKEWQTVKPLQGNLDPDLLVEGGYAMKQGLQHIFDAMGPKHIFNLGHGVVPQTPFEHVGQMVDFVHQFRI